MKKHTKAWEAPQNALGWLVLKLTGAKHLGSYKKGRTAEAYSWHYKGGLSLGKYIFLPFTELDRGNAYQRAYIAHEFGHSLQSEMLGWLYLPLIGLPSLIWAGCFRGYRRRRGVSYYTFYTERWADELGGVVR